MSLSEHRQYLESCGTLPSESNTTIIDGITWILFWTVIFRQAASSSSEESWLHKLSEGENRRDGLDLELKDVRKEAADDKRRLRSLQQM